MSSATSTHGPLRFLLGCAAFVVIVAGLRSAQALVVPLLLAAFLATVCGPAVRWLHNKGLPRGLALTIVIMASSVGLMFVAVLVFRSANEFTGQIPELQQSLTAKKNDAIAWLTDHGVPIDDKFNQEVFDVGGLTHLFTQLLVGLSSVFSNVFLVLLLLIFILLQASTYPAKLLAISGGSDEMLQRARMIQDAIMNYFTLKTLISLLTGVLVAVLTGTLGVSYPMLWGMLAFFFNYVPNIGSIIAAVPPVLLALVQHGLATAGWVAAGFVVINVVIGNAVEPRVMGKGLGLSTLVVFISLVFWGWVLGPVGMLLSVPLTMILKIVLEASDQTRWMAIVLSADADQATT